MSSGRVTVANSGIVITDGDDSHGVLAQSIGGGGGNAGMVDQHIVNRDAAKATQLERLGRRFRRHRRDLG